MPREIQKMALVVLIFSEGFGGFSQPTNQWLYDDMIIAMFGNQGEDVLISFSGTPWGGFCSEGRKHSIVNGQSFRLPIERPRKPLSEVRCFTPFWVIQVELQNVVVVLLVCAAVKNFCVTIG